MENEKEILALENEREIEENDFPKELRDDIPDERDFEIRRLILENEALRRKEAERILADDLETVRRIDPKIRKIEDLGDVFIALRAGGVPCQEAYRAVASLNTKKEIPQMGDILSFGEEKDFFTPDEVKGMTREEVKKNYDKIRKSMSKWKA